MANGVEIPITLEVTDIETGKVNVGDFQRDMKQITSGLQKTVNSLMSNIDTTKMNKALTGSLVNFEKMTSHYERANKNLQKSIEGVVTKTIQYKEDLAALQRMQSSLIFTEETLQDLRNSDDYLNAEKNVNAGKQLSYSQSIAMQDVENLTNSLEKQKREYYELQQVMSDSSNYLQFASKKDAQTINDNYQSVYLAFRKVMDSKTNVSNVISDNTMGDEAQAQLTGLSKMNDKMDMLLEKKYEMEQLEETESKQYQRLLIQIDRLNQKINESKNNLTAMVESGEAFRFDPAKMVTSEYEDKFNNITSEFAETQKRISDLSAELVPTEAFESYKKAKEEAMALAKKEFEVERKKLFDLKAEYETQKNLVSRLRDNAETAKNNKLQQQAYLKSLAIQERRQEAMRQKLMQQQTNVWRAQTKISAEEDKHNKLIQQKIEKNAKLNSEIDNLNSKLDSLTSKYQTLETEYNSAFNEAKPRAVKQAIEQISSASSNATSSANTLDNSLFRTSEILQSIAINFVKAFTSKSPQIELAKISEALDMLKAKAKATFESGISGAIDRCKQKMDDFVNKVKEGFSQIPSKVKQFGKSLLSLPFKAAKAGAKALASGIKNAASHMLRFNKSGKGTQNLGNSIKKLGRNFLRFGLGIRSAYFLVKRLKQAFTDAIKTMGSQFSDVQNDLNSLSQSFNQMKGSLGTAFQPIMSVVVPILNTLMGHITSALNLIGEFFASLTGQGFVYKVTAAAANSAANSMSNAGKAAEEAEKKLASYDKLDVIDSNKNKGSSGSGGGGSSSGTLPVTYTKTEISQEVNDFAKLFKESWEKADFTEVGDIIGKKIAGLLDVFNSEEVQTKISTNVNKFGHSIATGLNGLFQSGVLDSAGVALGNSINILLNGAITSIKGFQWEKNGQALGSGINKLIDTVEWDKIGLFFSSRISGIFYGISGVLETVDFTKLGQKIVDAFNGFNWSETITSIGRAVGLFLEGALDLGISLLDNVSWKDVIHNLENLIGQFFSSINWDDVGNKLFTFLGKAVGAGASLLANAGIDILKGALNFGKLIVDYFAGYIADAESSGGSVADGILNGIIDGFKNIGKWIKEHILDPFIEGFKSTFGIHSPAKEMNEPGEFVGKGILDGIASVFTNIKDWIKEHILDKITGAFEGFSLGDTISGAVGAVSGTVENITLKVSAIKDKAFDTVSEAWGNIKDKVSKWTTSGTNDKTFTNVKDTWDSVKSKTSTLTANAIQQSKDTFNKISTAWTNIKSKTATLTANIAAKVSDIKTWINNNVITPLNNKIHSVSLFKHISIPKLAQGAVIPANREFMAILGDQKHGTNVEAPLDTIKQALIEALKERGGSNQPIILQVNGKVVAQAVWDENKKMYRQTGKKQYAY